MSELKILEAKIKEVQGALTQYLRVHKISADEKNVTDMMNSIREIQTFIPGHQYIGLKTNEKGYITGYEVFDKVVNLQEIPKDLEKQYYKIDKYGRFVVDKEKQERFWGEQ
jgi:hypothetical protein